MIDPDVIVEYLEDGDLLQIHAELNKDPNLSYSGFNEDQGIDLISAIFHRAVCLAVDNMPEDAFSVGTCVCAEPITSATIDRGYCRGCLRPITVKVG